MNEAEIAALKAENENFKKQIEELNKKSAAPKNEGDDDEGDKTNNKDDDAYLKAQKENNKRSKSDSHSKNLEKALEFTMTIKNFYETHKDMMPNEVADLLRVVETENYDSKISKANAIKSGLIQSFFKVQSNIELLTPAQKSLVEDYLKLTKNGKEEQASDVYDRALEPALELMKRVKKAEELSKAKNGMGIHTSGEKNYIDKLIKGSQNKYLKQRGN
jgi:hypothetical protein